VVSVEQEVEQAPVPFPSEPGSFDVELPEGDGSRSSRRFGIPCDDIGSQLGRVAHRDGELEQFVVVADSKTTEPVLARVGRVDGVLEP